MLRTLLLCLGLGAAVPGALAAQDVRGGVRLGAGLDTSGSTVYTGQIELVEFGQSGSVELALAAFNTSSVERYQRTQGAYFHDYREATEVLSLGVVASFLWGHAPRGSGGPYLMLGLGLGPIDVDWRLRSRAVTVSAGAPVPERDVVADEAGWMAGPTASLGLGLRLTSWIDVRAQGILLIIPSTDLREELKTIPSITFTSGVVF